MPEKILNYILGVFIIVLLGISIFLFIKWENSKADLTQAILDNNKIGYELKLSENAMLSVGAINQHKMDSLIAAGNKKVDSVIKANNEHPLIVTKWKTNTSIEYVNVPTSFDENDSTFRFAEITEPNGWYHFKSRYQLKIPFAFMLQNLSLVDYWQTTTTKRPDNRVAVYITNKNPYVHIDSSMTLIDPVMVLQYKTDTLYKNSWQWGLGITTALLSPNKFTDIDFGIYAPFGLGIKTSYSIYNYTSTGERVFMPSFKDNWKIGIGFLRNF